MVLGKEQRNHLTRNKDSESKQKQCPVVDVNVSSGGESRVRCFKEQYYIGIWNVSSTNQGK